MLCGLLSSSTLLPPLPPTPEVMLPRFQTTAQSLDCDFQVTGLLSASVPLRVSMRPHTLVFLSLLLSCSRGTPHLHLGIVFIRICVQTSLTFRVLYGLPARAHPLVWLKSNLRAVLPAQTVPSAKPGLPTATGCRHVGV